MRLSVGSRLGHYEILAPIGAGGMGEVYRSKDTKLDREVAIKILPEAVARDPERLVRFEREAKALAALNHPNIAQIHGVEERALVMELDSGKRLIYAYGEQPRGQVFQLRATLADGSGQPVTLLSAATPQHMPNSISPDGKVLIGNRSTRSGNFAEVPIDVWALSLPEGSSADAKPRPFLESPFVKTAARFSPDGRWVAYQSNESGRNEIYVVPYPGPGGKSQVSTDGGTNPRWARNGRELFYRNGDKMMAVEVSQTGLIKAGGATALAQTNELHVVVNWFEELRRRMPWGGK